MSNNVGFVQITNKNLEDLPQMLNKPGSGVFVADARIFPGMMLTIDLFFNPKVNVEKRAILSTHRRPNLIDRDYRLVSKRYRKDPLRNLFESLKLGDPKLPTLFIVGYQATTSQGFLPDTPLYYFESSVAALKAVESFLTSLQCLREEGLDKKDFEKITAYIEKDLRTKAALRHNIEAGQTADDML